MAPTSVTNSVAEVPAQAPIPDLQENANPTIALAPNLASNRTSVPSEETTKTFLKAARRGLNDSLTQLLNNHNNLPVHEAFQQAINKLSDTLLTL